MSRDAEPRDRFARLSATLGAELDRLAEVVAEAELALRDFPEAVPPLREVRGIGDIVHDFYTGAERMWETVAPELNGGVPMGPSWHRELLDSMGLDLPSIRPPVLSRETVRELHEFLRFRHLFRHVYGFTLDWQRLKPLLVRMPAVWAKLESDMRQFRVFLDAGARR